MLASQHFCEIEKYSFILISTFLQDTNKRYVSVSTFLRNSNFINELHELKRSY